MEVAPYLLKIGIILNQECAKAALEKVAVTLVSSVEPNAVTDIQPLPSPT